jgi:ferric-dicitrate binding protein FerR (iron transport regulator)
MSDMRLFCKTVAVVTAFFLVIVSSRIQAIAGDVPRSWAIVTLTGSATINNAPAFSGQTLSAKNTIATAKSCSLTLDVPRATRLEVSEQTELSVEVLADLLRTELETGRVRLSTAHGTTTRVEIFPGLSVVSDPTMPAKFMAAVKDTTFELQVSEGTVDVVDSRDTSKGQQVTHVGPNMTFSNTGVLQNNNNQSNLTTGQRVAIIIAAGGVLALVLAILTGDDPVADGPGGCVVAPSGLSPQNPC